MIKLAVFDMDGTLTLERSSWEYVHRKLHLWNQKAERYQQLFLEGKINYYTFCQLDARDWAGLPVARVKELIDGIPLRPGVRELLVTLKSHRVPVAIISTGLTMLAARINSGHQLDYFVANDLETRNGLFTGRAIINVSTDEPGITKRDYLTRLMHQYVVKSEQVMTVGDSPGDIEMFEESSYAFLMTGDGADSENNAGPGYPGHTREIKGLGELRRLVEAILHR
ncbi:HAD-IB family phosphatase [Desulfallas thermosapovorans]|uniref:phosphoserine phosphatase n=1 Tax=Desulfallas thermosapovorans DSM 6562 TaxID=1121431 RepID=A0A5S4ZPV1_9FIRM|nr:HAD-IB family phosphatase [Desulfallas thermosapovorans]TYO94747.1 phosphoserine phosphatase [Desulfallas thermosapovorans DSM 6562]